MDLLTQLVTFFGEHGYLAVLLALLLCGAGAPLPEDVTLVAGGVITGLGYGNVHVMFGVCMVGVLAGDLIMFALGHHFGVRLLDWKPVARVLTPERYASIQRQFERYGNRVLFGARFLPGMRMPVFVTAGLTHRVSALRFLALDGAAALISVPIWVYAGYFGANHHEWLVRWVRRGQAGLWIIVGLLALAVIVWWWWRRKYAAGGKRPDEP